jgi:hypothetical protein
MDRTMLLMDVIASFSAGSIVNFMLLWPLLSLTMNKENKMQSKNSNATDFFF